MVFVVLSFCCHVSVKCNGISASICFFFVLFYDIMVERIWMELGTSIGEPTCRMEFLLSHQLHIKSKMSAFI
jgi:hypothetical protein